MAGKLNKQIDRRTFVKTTAATGAGILMSGHTLFANSFQDKRKKRYANVGTGSRSRMYQQAVMETFGEISEMVGFCDVNIGRLKLAQKTAKENYSSDVPIYLAEDFEKMIKETKPDVVIVTTVDGFHHKYIIRAMELGCDVMTEKPMTIDAEKCQDIIDTQHKTGRKCTVTFNYRYSPARSKVKELLMKGAIGDILSVDFNWMLNTHHGADYFRRWHSQKKFSGGLMVHKATHHFDLVNWWLSAIPVSVRATGKRDFYTPKTAKRFGLDNYHERCYTCPEKDKCTFRLELEKSESLKSLYLDNEQYDGYFRDKCVFRPDIDIEDTMNVLVNYDNNVTMCYSLNAFNSWEGYRVIFNGTQGRLEHTIKEKIYINDGSNKDQGTVKAGGTEIKVFPLRGSARLVEPDEGGIGGHGGGDGILQTDLFGLTTIEDELKRAADQRSGAYSIITGIAANMSMASGKTIQIKDILKNVNYPEYTPMPNHDDPLEMPGI
jgi:predicted dehydrogenase